MNLFHLTKVGLFVQIAFKRNKRLEMISFNYYKCWRFDNSYLMVEFQFKNAIGYRIRGSKGKTLKSPIILNLQNFESDTLAFEVFGFFQKQIYEINLKKDHRLNTNTFKTKIAQNNNLELVNPNIKKTIPQIEVQTNKTSLSFEEILISHKNININNNPFKIQDYI